MIIYHECIEFLCICEDPYTCGKSSLKAKINAKVGRGSFIKL